MDIIKDILLRFSMAILCGGGIVGVLLGATMLIKPERIVSLNENFSRWVSTIKIEQQFDRPRWIERIFYRHHRLVGALILIGAIGVLYTFLIRYNVRRISAAIAPGNWGLWDLVIATLLVGSVVAGLVGIIVLVRPSLLRELEKMANRWIATDGMLKVFNARHHFLDQHVLRHRKSVGVIMIIGSLYILIVLAPFLWRAGWKF